MTALTKAERIVGLLAKVLDQPVRTRPFAGGHELLDPLPEILAIGEALDVARELRDELAKAGD